MTSKKTVAISLGIAAIASCLWAWGSASAESKCVNVYVDYGVLKNNSKVTECVPVSQKTNALSVIEDAGLALEGTDKYGSQIVCRVDNLPSPVKPIGIKGHEDYVEYCLDMPAEYAYWAVLIKRAADPLNPVKLDSKWGWAQTGVSEVELNPGDSIGLVFADNENVRFPG
jgi:hypothetical protein